jgi:hypothetical protein
MNCKANSCSSAEAVSSPRLFISVEFAVSPTGRSFTKFLCTISHLSTRVRAAECADNQRKEACSNQFVAFDSQVFVI